MLLTELFYHDDLKKYIVINNLLKVCNINVITIFTEMFEGNTNLNCHLIEQKIYNKFFKYSKFSGKLNLPVKYLKNFNTIVCHEHIVVEKLSNVKNLYFSYNIIASDIKYLTCVRNLKINCDCDVNSVKKLKNVRNLKIDGFYLTSNTKKLKNTSSINFYLRPNFHDSNLTKLKNVTCLKLKGFFNGITYQSIKNIKHVYKLYFHCNNNIITDKELKYLCNIDTLCLTQCRKITNKGVKHLSNVRDLNLSYCRKITNKGVKYLSNVKKLNLEGCVIE